MRGLVCLLAVVCVIAAVGGCATSRVKGTSMRTEGIATGFINKTMQVNGVTRAYVVYVPPNYTPDKAWPLIVFLHGMGERGSDGLQQTQVSIATAIRWHVDRFPCLVVMPQCPGDVLWDKAVDDIDAALANTRQEYNADPNRIYLTGLSMGGFATWSYGAHRLDVYAALMPICGGGDPNDAPLLAKVPIWAFHGADDKTVPTDRSRVMVDAVKRAGGKIKYTEYKGVEHNSWDKTYDDPDAIKWLLSQRKGR